VQKSCLACRKQEKWNKVVVSVQPLVSLLYKSDFKLLKSNSKTFPAPFGAAKLRALQPSPQQLDKGSRLKHPSDFISRMNPHHFMNRLTDFVEIKNYEGSLPLRLPSSLSEISNSRSNTRI